VFSGVSADNFTPGHVARAVLEGIAEALVGFTREHGRLPEVADEFSRVIATGNGVRRNPLLASCLARAFETPVFVPEHEEEAAYGAAVLAGVRNGMWSSLEEVGRRFRLIHVAGPDDTN
jgi:sugar (pentulose or hexulose) kinase